MRILFIGGTGNLSSDCAALLASRGNEVLVLNRGKRPVPAGCRCVPADRNDPAGMKAALRDLRPDVVMDFIAYELADVEQAFQLFHHQLRQYVFISSATVYAKPPPKLPITEDSPFGNPWWEYARKKQACEEWLMARCREDRFPVTIVRPSHTYSHLWVPNPVSSSSYTFAGRLEQGRPVLVPDDGQNPWTLTAASDFAVAVAGLAALDDAIGEAVHITSDEVLTWNQIVQTIAEAVGARNPVVERIPVDFICQAHPEWTGNLKGDKVHPGVFDNSKIRKLVPEFKPAKPFAVGARESVAWLRAHPEQKNLSPQLDAVMDRIISAWRNSRG
jgi:nucleoside-diphosphate-sugar epimerase